MTDRYQAIRDGQCPPDLTYDELEAICREWRTRGDTIVFTNGCFDVLHAGHLELFAAASRRGSRLVIGVNSDEWVTRHKGCGRPLQSAEIRRAIAHCMGRADMSIVFNDETAERLLAITKPKTYIIGSDYLGKTIIGSEHCGEVIIMDRIPGLSTTELLAKACETWIVSGHA